MAGTILAFKTKSVKIAEARKAKKTQAKIELQARIAQTEALLLVEHEATLKLRDEKYWERKRLDDSQAQVELQRKYWERYLHQKIKKDGSLALEKIYTSQSWLYLETACRPIWNKQTHQVLVKFTFVFKTEAELQHQLGTLQAMLLCGARSSSDKIN